MNTETTSPKHEEVKKRLKSQVIPIEMLRGGKVTHIPFKMVTWQGHNYIVPQSTVNNK